MIKKAYADTPSGQMHYYYGGPQKKPPIIFLHQNVSSAKAFEPTLRLLIDQFHCIAVDLPGFGGSFDPPEFDSISTLTGYTMEFLDTLGFEKFHLCGSHTGAGMSAEISSLYPDRALSCMMIGALLFTEEQSARFRKEFSGSAAPGFDTAYLKETWDYVYDIGGKLDLDNMHGRVHRGVTQLEGSRHDLPLRLGLPLWPVHPEDPMPNSLDLRPGRRSLSGSPEHCGGDAAGEGHRCQRYGHGTESRSGRGEPRHY